MLKIRGKIFDKHNPFIIAEAGINHNGKLKNAMKMVDVAKSAGCSAIKFQTFKASEFLCKNVGKIKYKYKNKFINESLIKMFKRSELSEKDFKKIKHYCDEKKIIFFSTPQNLSDLEILKRVGVPLLKIGSDDFINLHLIKNFIKTKKPLILSCGMSDLAEVKRSLKVANFFKGYPVALLICTSEYPTKLKNINLNKLTYLKKKFKNLTLGLSDHTKGNLASVVARILGAEIFEKHFTLNKNFKGPDHNFSLDPLELKNWVANIKSANDVLGNYKIAPTALEKINKKIFRRKIIAIKKIKKNEIFSIKNIALKRSNSKNGYFGDKFESFLGKKSKKNYSIENLIDQKL